MRFYGDDEAVMTPPTPKAEEVITIPKQEYLTTVLCLEEAFKEIRRLDALYKQIKP